MAEGPIEITPYDQSGLIKPPDIVNLNYTNQNFWSMKTRLVDFINERFGEEGTELPNTFNDLVESSIAIMLIENVAFVADTLSFKIDQVTNELYIDTVTEVENAFRLSKLVGFTPQPPIAARSFWSASINNPLNTDLVIPGGFSVTLVSEGITTAIELFPADSNDVPLLDEDIILPSGATSNQNIIGLEGVTNTQNAVGTGSPSQSITLTNSPVIYDSVRVRVNGVNWEKVDYFTDSNPRREFRVEFDSDYQAFVMFGNNQTGIIPSAGSAIEITYRVGGGTAGNIVTGFLETQTQIFVPGLQFTVPVSLRNYTKGEFGYNGDNIEDIRRKLPRWTRTQNRVVSGDDYKIFTDGFASPYHGSIGKSSAILRNHGCSGNIIDLYILAKEGSNGLVEASNALKVDLNDALNEKKMLTDFVCIKNGEVLVVDVSIDITLDRIFKKFETELRTTILNKVNSFFNLNKWDYDENLKESDLIKELSDIKEVKSYDVNFVTSDADNSGSLVTTNFYQIIRFTSNN